MTENNLPESSLNQNPPVGSDPREPIRDEVAFQQDGDYLQFVSHYQQADWDQCSRLLAILAVRFPNNQALANIIDEFNIQNEAQSKSGVDRNNKRHKKALTWIILGAGVMVLLVMAGIFTVQRGKELFHPIQPTPTPTSPALDNQAGLHTLEVQAREMVQAGKVDETRKLLNNIRMLDPQYPALDELTRAVDALAEIDARYTEAQRLLSNGDDKGAYAILTEIHTSHPFYRDVEYQLSQLDRKMKVDELLAQATTAYQAQDWEGVINSYEAVLQLEPDIQVENMEEQLFTSYYQRIEAILKNPNTTVEDINKTEHYYTQAVSLVPQNKKFSTQRRNLQNIMADLMVVAYRQTARKLINDPAFSEQTLSSAASYLQKVSILAPDSLDASVEMARAQTYLQGVQAFDQLDWDTAIVKFQAIANIDNSYAGGMLKQLLYEAQMTRGRRYYGVGYYSYARTDFEAAEVLAWDSANPLQLFQTQVMMGYTLGKLNEYEKADSYFAFVLTKDNLGRLNPGQSFLSEVASAQAAASQRQFYQAYLLYSDALKDIKVYYLISKVSVKKGDNLAGRAFLNKSTLMAIQEANNLPDVVLAKSDQILDVPSLP